MPTTDELAQDLKDLTARVNQIDGINVPDKTNSALFQIYALINQLKSDLRSVTLTLDGEAQKLTKKVDDMKALLGSHLGV